MEAGASAALTTSGRDAERQHTLLQFCSVIREPLTIVFAALYLMQ